ncbi:hypothetical protein GCM10009086_02500 [Pseudomonas rhodesiae]
MTAALARVHTAWAAISSSFIEVGEMVVAVVPGSHAELGDVGAQPDMQVSSVPFQKGLASPTGT